MLRIQEIPANSVKRGGCLSLLLMFFIYSGIVMIVANFADALVTENILHIEMPLMLNIIRMVMGGLTIIFGVAAWKWKKWGMWGLGATIGFDIFFGYLLVNFGVDIFGYLFLVVLTLIRVGLLGYFAQRRWALFE